MREAGWITKAEAAALLECDERTIERRARASKITARARPGFPTLYLASDVEILKQTGAQEVQTGILETVPAPSSNGHGAVASLRGRSPAYEEAVLELVQTVQRALTQAPTGPTGPTNAPTGPTGPTLSPDELAAQYLTLAEASAIKHLSQAYLRRQVEAGTLKAIRDRGWRIRRKDLEQL